MVEQRAKRAIRRDQVPYAERQPEPPAVMQLLVGGMSLGRSPVATDIERPVVIAEELVAMRTRPQERPGFEHRVGPRRVGLESMVPSAQGRDVLARGGATFGVRDHMVGVGLAC